MFSFIHSIIPGKGSSTQWDAELDIQLGGMDGYLYSWIKLDWLIMIHASKKKKFVYLRSRN